MAKFEDIREGSGIAARTRRVKVLDGTEENHTDQALDFLRGLDRLNYAWGRHAKFIEAIKKWYEVEAANLPADPVETQKRLRPRTTDVSYLFESVRRIRLVEKNIATRPWEAVSLAMEIMELFDELTFRSQFEAAVLADQKMKDGRLESAKARRRQPADTRRLYVEAAVARGHSKRNAMRLAAKHFDVHYSTISSDCYSKKRSKSD